MHAGLYHGRVMDHEQLTFCSISVILHSRQSTGNLSYSGKIKWESCRYPQRLQSVFKIHFNDSKTQCKKVPLDVLLYKGQDAEPTGDTKPGQSVGSSARRSWLVWEGLWTCSFLDCIEFSFFVHPQPKGRAVRREKFISWRIWWLTGTTCPALVPGSDGSSWRFSACWIDVRLV